jgi:hypothetical protein
MLRHRTYGTPIEETVEAFPNELPIDAVGLWQIVNSLKRGFDLENPELAKYVQKSVEALLKAGAVPVIGSTEDKYWHRASGFGGQDKEVIEQVLAYLQRLGRDPDFGDIWFALPKFIEGASEA